MGTRGGARALELVPIFYYRDKTRVQMFIFTKLKLHL